MILGLGNDLTDIRRFEHLWKRFPGRLQKALFTEGEYAYALGHRSPAAELAKRFSAKEACAKALGVGLKLLGAKTSEGIGWKDVEVCSDVSGQPQLRLLGKAWRRLLELTPAHATPTVHVSLSDQYPYAFATVILSAGGA
ncbi:MAG: holo-ACP synthase [Holosporales bacterium]|jgi:holo-[acyl-carrier protein] synthase|nr:holo-ACP synthase [Holosporales bacterium]